MGKVRTKDQECTFQVIVGSFDCIYYDGTNGHFLRGRGHVNQVHQRQVRDSLRVPQQQTALATDVER